MSKATQAIRLFFKSIQSMLISGEDLNEKDTILLVIGTAGSGKTSFVNTVAQKCHLRVDHDLSGGTKKVWPVRCTSKMEIPRVVLVDTPPIPDDCGEKEIPKWLKNIRNVHVKGIIYLHSITANRAQPDQAYNKLRYLTGGELGDVPVILVMTFWKQDGPPIQDRRKEELEAGWESACIKGPPPRVYDRTPDNAWDIVGAILKEGGIDLADHHVESLN